MKIDWSVLLAIGIVLVCATVLAALKITTPEVFSNLAVAVITWLAPSPLKIDPKVTP